MAQHLNLYKTFNIHENTPVGFYKQLNEEFFFDFDPCPPNPEFGGLKKDWNGNIYINPPYGKAIRRWLEKALEEIKKGNAKTCVFLLPSYTDVKWFHEIVLPNANEIRFIKGRLKFGDHKQSAPFANVLVIFKGK
jgi:site-specific DNA-methyltransferase (adenine-specific)